MYRDIPDDLREIIEPIVAAHGCELVDVDIATGTGSPLLRITIDNEAGDGRVPVDSCANVSRELETQLDARAIMPGRYRLEVSSPGLNRVLSREKDFAAACGMEVKLKTRRPLDGRRRFRGVLIDYRDGVAHIEVDGKEAEIRFDDIEKANTIYQFSRADFASGAAK